MALHIVWDNFYDIQNDYSNEQKSRLPRDVRHRSHRIRPVGFSLFVWIVERELIDIARLSHSNAYAKSFEFSNEYRGDNDYDCIAVALCTCRRERLAAVDKQKAKKKIRLP